MDIPVTRNFLIFLLIIILDQTVCNMPPKRGKTYKEANISDNIQLQETSSDADELRYMGAAFSDSSALILSLNKFLIGLKALYLSISSQQKKKTNTRKYDSSTQKSLKSKAEKHSNSSEERKPNKKKTGDSIPVIRPELYKALEEIFKFSLGPYYASLKELESGALYIYSQAHLKNQQQNSQLSQMHKRRKRQLDLSSQKMQKSLKSSKSLFENKILVDLTNIIAGVFEIISLLTNYKDSVGQFYNHCTDSVCVKKVSIHLKEFSKKSKDLDKNLKKKFFGEPEFEIKTSEELNSELQTEITRVKAFVNALNVKEEKILVIDSDALWEVFELDLYKLKIQPDEQLSIQNLMELELLLNEELKKAQRFKLKFPDYVERDKHWKGILLNSIFQLKQIEEIYIAKWHEMKAFLAEKDHSHHSFRNCMYYQGKIPAGMRIHDSGASIFMILNNALQYMNILNDCVSVDASSKTLLLDWDKMTRMGPFGHFTAERLLENQESQLLNRIIYLPLLNKRLRGMEKLLSAAKESLFQLHDKQKFSTYWNRLIESSRLQLYKSAHLMEEKMVKLLEIHRKQKQLRMARGEMDIDPETSQYGASNEIHGQTADESMLELRYILSAPILDMLA